MKLNPQGKIALISGANRGIGKAILHELLAKGVSKVYAGARNTATLNELVNQYGDKVVPLELDVTNKESIKAAAALAYDVDILINNAGILSSGKVLSEEASSSLEANLNVNVWGVVNLTNAFVKELKKSSDTAIINISSLAGLGNMPMFGTYSVSKAAVHSITQGMRAELTGSNTLVMGVYPGAIDTDMTASVEMDKDSPENVARSIVNGLSEGEEDIYPDVFSVQMGAVYASSPKTVEKEFANFA